MPNAGSTTPPAASHPGLGAALAALEVGPPAHHHNLTLIPLFAPAAAVAPGMTLLSEAIAAGTARVEEVSAAGTVSTLALANLGDEPILVPEGEILVGAKQHRVVNVTVVVAAGTKVPLGVSCVERGRWHAVSRHFSPGAWASPQVRAHKLDALHRQKRGEAALAQSRVWEAVDLHLRSQGVESPTASFVDGFEAAKERNGAYRERLKLPAGACGVVAGKGDEVLGIDLFDSPRALAALWDRLSEAYFAEAAVDEASASPTPPEKAREFLGRLAAAARPDPDRPGPGEGIEIDAPGLAGSGLVWEGAIRHLAAFAT